MFKIDKPIRMRENGRISEDGRIREIGIINLG